MNIQWYPGHMTAARRMLQETLPQVDAVCEILDARIPYASGNPDIRSLTENKPRLVVLNRADLADPAVTALWAAWFKKNGHPVLETDSKSGAGVNRFAPAVRDLLRDKLRRYEQRGQAGRPLRIMVAGIPNVGKSSFINRISGRKPAKAEDRPGVTRGRQWVVVASGLELLDTPGILWPRLDSEAVGLNLAFTGAVKDEILDLETLAFRLMERLDTLYPRLLAARYGEGLVPGSPGHLLLDQAARRRGFLVSGGEPDLERMAKVLLDEFRGGVLGRISLERPPENGKEVAMDGGGEPSLDD
ncbi:ribosome biogenesis GTPase YlqF [Papillibacter cinnamivorans]|uniref:Ribosome biogenesis GTPase A n=1 Tax=Papillibacter cinnamivorans DSM 12816 TaxID=1122930 RepID=A0A1W1YTW3_9FIRM|nr:ribosome biogenesis GTPase YlqF [Papillibacter cinnamivorans]SMC39647.1 ribosome biogenesis GTPase A [Papillibacter cinnamivorans DSM 12816]